MAYIDRMNGWIRALLQDKQQERADNEAAGNDAAVRRNDKSIALLVKKLLCPHQLEYSSVQRYGRKIGFVRCSLCKTTISDTDPV